MSDIPCSEENKKTDFLLDRDLHRSFPVVKGGEGNYLYLANDRKIFDATGGAAVSCLGHGEKRVIEAVYEQMCTGTPYLATTFFACDVVEELCKELVAGTEGELSSVYLTGSGSEAMEAAMKLGRQYFYETDRDSQRINFISRETSYHGNTAGALGVSGFKARRAPYEPMLTKNTYHVSSCNPYRQRPQGQSDATFVANKAAELERMFQELGPNTVIGFICEPIVGAALGCIPSVPGYLQAMKDVCHRHGALFILDEVMCGMGRCGLLHAWQEENVVPDLQTIGKGLGGGYQPIAAVLVASRIVDALKTGTGQFIHGQTYQAMPVQAAAALAVLRIIRDDDLLSNVRIQGAHLEQLLKSLLANHPNVGDIRGKGLFWGIEFVKDKQTKEPFDPSLAVSRRLMDTALSKDFNMTLYAGSGSMDGDRGDHVLLAPPFNVDRAGIEHIAQTTSAVVHSVFDEIGSDAEISKKWTQVSGS